MAFVGVIETQLGLAVFCIAQLKPRDVAKALSTPKFPGPALCGWCLHEHWYLEHSLGARLQHSHLFGFYISGFPKKYFNQQKGQQKAKRH